MTIICALAGTLIVVATLFEAFEALVLPRRVTRPFRFTRFYYVWAWHGWGLVTDRLPAGASRQTFLSLFGPLSLLGLFALWGAGLVLGFGLIQFAVAAGALGLLDAVYLSGVTLTTVGYGDVAPTGFTSRLLAVVEGGTGLGFVAIVIG